MSPYFYQFVHDLLSEKSRDLLRNLADENNDLFFQYQSATTGTIDNNCYLTVRTLPEFTKEKYSEIFDLLDSCVLANYPIIMMHFPGIHVPMHRDDPNRRNCVISIPIQPVKGYSPTHFYKLKSEQSHAINRQPIASAEFINGYPCLLNTQELHGLTNQSSQKRYNFQICFHESWEVVYNLVLENKLFTENFS